MDTTTSTLDRIAPSADTFDEEKYLAEVDRLADDTAAALEDDFYTARDWTEQIMHAADYKRMAREGLLGAALAVMASRIPPAVTCDLTGRDNPMPLNVFINLAGETGGGKSRTLNTARTLFPTDGAAPESVPASGEAISAQFVERRKDENGWQTVTKATRLLMPCIEVSQVSALAGRTGSTLIPQLLHGYSGERLGAGTKGKDIDLCAPAMSYRLCAVFGVQPALAGLFMADGITNGLAGRFMYFKTTDPTIRHRPTGKKTATAFWTRLAEKLPTRPVSVQYPKQARREALDMIEAGTAGEVDELDGHRVENIGRVAALYALADGRTAVSMDDWRLAGRVMDLSDRNRRWLFERYAAEARRTLADRIQVQSDAKDDVEETKIEKAMDHIMRTITRKGQQWATDGGTYPYMAMSPLHRAMGRHNARFRVALERLEERGEIIRTTDQECSYLVANPDLDTLPIQSFHPLNR